MRKKNLSKLSIIIHIINILVLFIIYGYLNDIGSLIAPFIGLWSIFLLGYRIFWQFLRLEEIFIKDQKKEKNNKKITKT